MIARRLGSACVAIGLTGLFGVGGIVQAQGSNLSLSPSRPSVLVTPLRAQTVRVTAANAGPASVVGAVVNSVVPVNDTNVVVTVAANPPCTATLVPVAGGVNVSWTIAALGVGQSVACDFVLLAAATATTSSSRFDLGILAGGNLDPVSSNNFSRTEVFHSALDRPVDVDLTVQRVPGGFLRPGTVQALDLTFRNLGPNTPVNMYALSNSYSIAPGPNLNYPGYDVVPNAETAPCTYVRDTEGAAVFYLAVTVPSPLAPGESRRCRLSILAFPDAQGVSDLTWTAYSQGEGVYDPVDANSVITIAVPFGQAATQVPNAPWLSAALVTLILLVANARLRRI